MHNTQRKYEYFEVENRIFGKNNMAAPQPNLEY